MGARRRQHDERDSLGMLPWFPRDWRASTARATLSLLGRLAYRELLDAAWLEGGSLPSSDASLAALAGFKPHEWARVKAEVLVNFFIGPDGRLRQKRLTWEHERASQLRESRRLGAYKANRAMGRSTNAQRTVSVGIPSTVNRLPSTVHRQPETAASGLSSSTEPPPPAEALPEHDPDNELEARLALRVYDLAERAGSTWREVLWAVSETPNGKHLTDVRDASPDWIRATLRDCDAFEADLGKEE